MGATVGPELSIHFIQRTFWQHQHDTKPIILHYHQLFA